jgi:hypothetical protein
MSPNGLNSLRSLTRPSTPFSPPNSFPTRLFFSSVVRRIIFLVAPALEEDESLPSLPEDEEAPEEEVLVSVPGLGAVGSGIR